MKRVFKFMRCQGPQSQCPERQEGTGVAHKLLFMWQAVADCGDAMPAVLEFVAVNSANTALPPLFDYCLGGGLAVVGPPLAILFCNVECSIEDMNVDIYVDDRVRAIQLLLDRGAIAGAPVSIYSTKQQRPHSFLYTTNVLLFACGRLPCRALLAMLAALLPAVPRRSMGRMFIKLDGFEFLETSPLEELCGEKEYRVHIPPSICGWGDELDRGIALLVKHGADAHEALASPQLTFGKDAIAKFLEGRLFLESLRGTFVSLCVHGVTPGGPLFLTHTQCTPIP